MSKYVPADLRRRIRDAFFSCCAYCQADEALTVAIFEIEHIIPLAAGGATEFGNLCLACPSCNRFKSNRFKSNRFKSNRFKSNRFKGDPMRELKFGYFILSKTIGLTTLIGSLTGRSLLG